MKSNLHEEPDHTYIQMVINRSQTPNYSHELHNLNRPCLCAGRCAWNLHQARSVFPSNSWRVVRNDILGSFLKAYIAKYYVDKLVYFAFPTFSAEFSALCAAKWAPQRRSSCLRRQYEWCNYGRQNKISLRTGYVLPLYEVWNRLH